MIAFHKLGTIATSQPSFTDVIWRVGDERSALASATKAEGHNRHPQAQTVSRAARLRKLDWPAASDVQAVTGEDRSAFDRPSKSVSATSACLRVKDASSHPAGGRQRASC